MPPILLVTGSPASGKSTISRNIAEQSAKGLHIPVDDLRTMVHGGIIHPGPTWTSELIQQLNLARQTAVEMALRYQAAGFLVAIDDFWDPNSQLQEYAALINNPKVLPIILKPELSIVIARNHTRQPASEFRNHMDDGIREIYADLNHQEPALATQGWHILDTSKDTPQETSDRLLAMAEAT